MADYEKLADDNTSYIVISYDYFDTAQGVAFNHQRRVLSGRPEDMKMEFKNLRESNNYVAYVQKYHSREKKIGTVHSVIHYYKGNHDRL